MSFFIKKKYESFYILDKKMSYKFFTLKKYSVEDFLRFSVQDTSLVDYPYNSYNVKKNAKWNLYDWKTKLFLVSPENIRGHILGSHKTTSGSFNFILDLGLSNTFNFLDRFSFSKRNEVYDDNIGEYAINKYIQNRKEHLPIKDIRILKQFCKSSFLSLKLFQDYAFVPKRDADFYNSSDFFDVLENTKIFKSKYISSPENYSYASFLDTKDQRFYDESQKHFENYLDFESILFSDKENISNFSSLYRYYHSVYKYRINSVTNNILFRGIYPTFMYRGYYQNNSFSFLDGFYDKKISKSFFFPSNFSFGAFFSVYSSLYILKYQEYFQNISLIFSHCNSLFMRNISSSNHLYKYYFYFFLYKRINIFRVNKFSSLLSLYSSKAFFDVSFFHLLMTKCTFFFFFNSFNIRNFSYLYPNSLYNDIFKTLHLDYSDMFDNASDQIPLFKYIFNGFPLSYLCDFFIYDVQLYFNDIFTDGLTSSFQRFTNYKNFNNILVETSRNKNTYKFIDNIWRSHLDLGFYTLRIRVPSFFSIYNILSNLYTIKKLDKKQITFLIDKNEPFLNNLHSLSNYDKQLYKKRNQGLNKFNKYNKKQYQKFLKIFDMNFPQRKKYEVSFWNNFKKLFLFINRKDLNFMRYLTNELLIKSQIYNLKHRYNLKYFSRRINFFPFFKNKYKTKKKINFRKIHIKDLFLSLFFGKRKKKSPKEFFFFKDKSKSFDKVYYLYFKKKNMNKFRKILESNRVKNFDIINKNMIYSLFFSPLYLFLKKKKISKIYNIDFFDIFEYKYVSQTKLEAFSYFDFLSSHKYESIYNLFSYKSYSKMSDIFSVYKCVFFGFLKYNCIFLRSQNLLFDLKKNHNFSLLSLRSLFLSYGVQEDTKSPVDFIFFLMIFKALINTSAFRPENYNYLQNNFCYSINLSSFFDKLIYKSSNKEKYEDIFFRLKENKLYFSLYFYITNELFDDVQSFFVDVYVNSFIKIFNKKCHYFLSWLKFYDCYTYSNIQDILFIFFRKKGIYLFVSFFLCKYKSQIFSTAIWSYESFIEEFIRVLLIKFDINLKVSNNNLYFIFTEIFSNVSFNSILKNHFFFCLDIYKHYCISKLNSVYKKKFMKYSYNYQPWFLSYFSGFDFSLKDSKIYYNFYSFHSYDTFLKKITTNPKIKSTISKFEVKPLQDAINKKYNPKFKNIFLRGVPKKWKYHTRFPIIKSLKQYKFLKTFYHGIISLYLYNYIKEYSQKSKLNKIKRYNRNIRTNFGKRGLFHMYRKCKKNFYKSKHNYYKYGYVNVKVFPAEFIQGTKCTWNESLALLYRFIQRKNITKLYKKGKLNPFFSQKKNSISKFLKIDKYINYKQPIFTKNKKEPQKFKSYKKVFKKNRCIPLYTKSIYKIPKYLKDTRDDGSRFSLSYFFKPAIKLFKYPLNYIRLLEESSWIKKPKKFYINKRTCNYHGLFRDRGESKMIKPIFYYNRYHFRYIHALNYKQNIRYLYKKLFPYNFFSPFDNVFPNSNSKKKKFIFKNMNDSYKRERNKYTCLIRKKRKNNRKMILRLKKLKKKFKDFNNPEIYKKIDSIIKNRFLFLKNKKILSKQRLISFFSDTFDSRYTDIFNDDALYFHKEKNNCRNSNSDPKYTLYYFLKNKSYDKLPKIKKLSFSHKKLHRFSSITNHYLLFGLIYSYKSILSFTKKINFFQYVLNYIYTLQKSFINFNLYSNNMIIKDKFLLSYEKKNKTSFRINNCFKQNIFLSFFFDVFTLYLLYYYYNFFFNYIYLIMYYMLICQKQKFSDNKFFTQWVSDNLFLESFSNDFNSVNKLFSLYFIQNFWTMHLFLDKFYILKDLNIRFLMKSYFIKSDNLLTLSRIKNIHPFLRNNQNLFMSCNNIVVRFNDVFYDLIRYKDILDVFIQIKYNLFSSNISSNNKQDPFLCSFALKNILSCLLYNQDIRISSLLLDYKPLLHIFTNLYLDYSWLYLSFFTYFNLSSFMLKSLFFISFFKEIKKFSFNISSYINILLSSKFYISYRRNIFSKYKLFYIKILFYKYMNAFYSSMLMNKKKSFSFLPLFESQDVYDFLMDLNKYNIYPLKSLNISSSENRDITKEFYFSDSKFKKIYDNKSFYFSEKANVFDYFDFSSSFLFLNFRFFDVINSSDISLNSLMRDNISYYSMSLLMYSTYLNDFISKNIYIASFLSFDNIIRSSYISFGNFNNTFWFGLNISEIIKNNLYSWNNFNSNNFLYNNFASISKCHNPFFRYHFEDNNIQANSPFLFWPYLFTYNLRMQNVSMLENFHFQDKLRLFSVDPDVSKIQNPLYNFDKLSFFEKKDQNYKHAGSLDILYIFFFVQDLLKKKKFINHKKFIDISLYLYNIKSNFSKTSLRRIDKDNVFKNFFIKFYGNNKNKINPKKFFFKDISYKIDWPSRSFRQNVRRFPFYDPKRKYSFRGFYNIDIKKKRSIRPFDKKHLNFKNTNDFMKSYVYSKYIYNFFKLRKKVELLKKVTHNKKKIFRSKNFLYSKKQVKHFSNELYTTTFFNYSFIDYSNFYKYLRLFLRIYIYFFWFLLDNVIIDLKNKDNIFYSYRVCLLFFMLFKLKKILWFFFGIDFSKFFTLYLYNIFNSNFVHKQIIKSSIYQYFISGSVNFFEYKNYSFILKKNYTSLYNKVWFFTC